VTVSLYYFQTVDIKDDYCGSHSDMNSWIDGHIPVTQEAAIMFPERILTALTVHQIYENTVLFAGAKDGTVTKVSVKRQVYMYSFLVLFFYIQMNIEPLLY